MFGFFEKKTSGFSVKWYRKLAEQGDADAQYNLGYMFENGQDTPQDYIEAVKWYRESAEQGGAKAQNNLARMYYEGQSVRQDYKEAVKWFKKAENKGMLQRKTI